MTRAPTAAPAAAAGRRSPRLPAVADLPQAFIFDMDGLMLDTERLDRDLWRAAARRRSFDFPDTLHAALVGRRADISEQTLRAHFGADFPLAQVQAEIHDEWLALAQAGALPRKPGLDAVLDTLAQAAVPLAVATSTARAKALLSLGPLAARFGVLTFGDEVAQGKPAPDIYRLAAERLQAAPGQCLVLEDSPAGVAAAQAAGMTVIMIPDLVEPAVPPPYECASLHDVHAWLLALLARRAGA